MSKTPTFEGMLASRPLTKRCPETGKLYPADIPREECQCGYLPRYDTRGLSHEER
jgi:hypothetical protein